MNRESQAAAKLRPSFVVLLMWLMVSILSVEVSAQLESGQAGQALIFPTNRPITGRVIDTNGLPILGAIVSHFGDSNERHDGHRKAPYKFANSDSTDLFGKFTLENLNPRRARVCVFHPDYEAVFVSPISLYSDVVLLEARSVSGLVLNHLGEPVEGVRFRPSWSNFEEIDFEVPEYQTDKSGRVVLKGISQTEGGNYLFVEAETEAGPFRARFVWFPGKARSTWEAMQPAGSIVAEGNDFEMRLPQPDPVRLEFVEIESDRPAMVDSAEFWTLRTPDSTRQWRQQGLPTDGNSVDFGFLRPGLNYISIKMKPESMVPDQLVVIERAANVEPMGLKTIQVARGVRVTGRVIEQGTLKPIADAAVAYMPSGPSAQLRNGINPPKFVRSDKDGNFELVVAAAKAKLRVEGECGVFLTPPVESGISSSGSMVERSKLIKNFEISIEPKPGEHVELPAFELERSKLIRGRVVDQQGVAVSEAEFLVTLSSYQTNLSPIYGTTDEKGRFELDNVLTNALTDLPNRRGNHQVLCWDRNRTLLGQAEFSDKTEADLEVVLKPANAVLGRVIDGISKQPLAGVMLTLRAGNRLEIGAKTADDGTFLLEFANPEKASFMVYSPGYTRVHESVEFTPDQILKEIDDIVITAYDAYGKPERVPDVSNLAIDDALSVLDGYLQTELNRIPETQPGYRWNDSEPQFIFKKKVAIELNASVKKMLERFTNSEDQVRLGLMVFERLSQDRASTMIPYTTATMLLYEEVVLKNLDNPVVLAAERTYRVQWKNPNHADIVLKNNETDGAKLWAVRKILGDHSTLLMGLRGPKQQSDDRFEQTFKNMKLAWLLGLNEFSEESYSHLQPRDLPKGMKAPKGQPLRNVVRNQVAQTQQQLLGQNYDQGRAARVQELIDSLDQKSP